jgi:hypothetical protein
MGFIKNQVVTTPQQINDVESDMLPGRQPHGEARQSL